MKSVGSYLLVFFMVMFWLFRIIVAFTATMGLNFAFEPLNQNIEIILLFVTMLCLILIVKRKLIGAIIYLIGYGMYFGVDIYNIVTKIMNGASIEITQYASILTSFIGIILPICILFELLLDKNRKAHPVDKKTDWFYANEQFDRKMDERADKNNYRTM